MKEPKSSIPAELEFRKVHTTPNPEFVELVKRMIPHRANALAAAAMKAQGISPFVEVGAEFCLNGMMLASWLGEEGFCVDISSDALGSAETYAKSLGFERIPRRVCANAERLPFANRSFEFTLFWGTLHHFDSPRRALLEARRILRPDGWLYFEEEPIRRRLAVPLFTTGVVPYELSVLESLLLKVGILPFVARIGAKRELKAGLREAEFGLKDFFGLFDRFELIDYHLRPLLTGGVPSAPSWVSALARKLFTEPSGFLTRWFGGEVAGFARAGKRAAMLEGGMLLVARDIRHDVVGLDSEPELDEVVMFGRRVKSDGKSGRLRWFRIPEAFEGHRFIAVELGGATLSRVALDSQASEGLFFQYSFYTNPPLLACPDCVYVRDFCEPNLCGRDCERACSKGAITFADKAVIDRNLCDGCGDCLFACPFEALDRPVLNETDTGFTCGLCSRIFVKRDGIALARDGGTDRLAGRK